MSSTVLIGAEHVSVSDIADVAQRAAEVRLAPAAPERLDRAYRFVQQLADSKVPIYGLTTGCGPLAGYPIAATEREAFQRNLIRSHAVTLGAPHPPVFVRAAMAVRAQVFAQGYSGVDPAAVDLLLAVLNAGLHPVVREIGSVGASGDLVELAQIALAMIGEGQIESAMTAGPKGRSKPFPCAASRIRRPTSTTVAC